MKIRNKLTLLYSVIFAGILLLFAFFFYFSFARDQAEGFYEQIKQQAITKVYLLFDLNINPKVMQTIHANNAFHITNEEVAVYDQYYRLIYHDAENKDIVKETKSLLDSIRLHKELRYTYGDYSVTAFTLKHNNETFIVTVAAIDRHGQEKLKVIKENLAFGFCLSVLLIIVAGRFSAEQALKPVSDMVKNVEEITASNLDQRINTGNDKDELAELAITFNEMLDRLEKTFEAQKDFVSNIAHELRTPLSSIIAELELSRHKNRSIAQYQSVIELALTDAQALAKLTNSLLDLAKASYDPAQIAFKRVRVDEVLLDARQQLQKQNADFHIRLTFQETDDSEENISISGNAYLLQVAFENIMENACKFSADHTCIVNIAYREKYTLINFTDHGIGISKDELNTIFKPFFRGKNHEFAGGYGIGMALCEKIVHLHQGKITVESQLGQGTTFQIALPHI